LERLRDLVGDDGFLLLQYERCVDDPVAELRRTYAYLGVDPDVVPDALVVRHRQGGSPTPPMPDDVRAAMVEYYLPHVQRLAASFPALDIERFPNFAGLL
jgi:hypothetical protein